MIHLLRNLVRYLSSCKLDRPFSQLIQIRLGWWAEALGMLG